MMSSRLFRHLFVASLVLSTAPHLAVTTAFAADKALDQASSAGVFRIFKGADNQYYFHLLAGNHKKVLRSEGYTTLAAAKKGIASIKKNGINAKAYELREAANGEYYFNLKAANGEIIGTSETYKTKANAERGASTVRELVSKDPGSEEAAPRSAKFEVFTGADGNTYFNLVAENGEIVLSSEGYASPSNARRGIESVRTHGRQSASYQILDTRDGKAYFRLVAPNREIIGRSEVYASRANVERAVRTIAALLASAKIADPT